MTKKAYLILQNGDVFEGKSFGAEGTVISEIVFNTAMTGYIEALTDKSYYGQTPVYSFPLIGNYGAVPEALAGQKLIPSAYIAKHWCDSPSNFRSEEDIDSFFKAKNIVGLCEIDTRTLIKTLRDHGTMNGMITTDLSKVDHKAIAEYRVRDAVKNVTTRVKYVVPCKNAKYRIALLDLGVREDLIQTLVGYGCEVHVFPASSPSHEILAVNPDGIVLAGGPGEPTDNNDVVQTLRSLKPKNIPTFGLRLGHQLLAMANGGVCKKLPHGHRGGNHPVKNTETGRVYISSQNHGFAVDPSSLDGSIARISFVNTNDGTCEGIDYLDTPAFSLQFEPDACQGANNKNPLYERFISMMEGAKNA